MKQDYITILKGFILTRSNYLFLFEQDNCVNNYFIPSDVVDRNVLVGMIHSNPIAMETNKIKTRRTLHYLSKTDNRNPKIIDLVKEPNALLERYKRSITLSQGNSLTRTREVQQNYLQNAYWGSTKRIFDIIISGSVTVFVLSWMYPLLFILIKLESKGPVIFKQKRNGLDQ